MVGLIVVLVVALAFFIAWSAMLIPGAKLPFNLIPTGLVALFSGWTASWFVRHGPHYGNIFVLPALVGAIAGCAALGWFMRTTLWTKERPHARARTVHVD